ncbi:hypothetical protein [Nocardiopsis quinghaiensis]|uniref:hypothetical protein n=1 Tax=Nocardiopsis quinghaiensis TaxID=464995 RepID=UPI00123B57E6|nr:hypothetical protein [Nocardiopsis quinghaiensis]
MLFAAPVLAIAATLLLMTVTGQVFQVLTWGALMTLVAAAPIAVPTQYRRTAIWVCAALLLVAVVLSVLSIGMFFVPALIALAVAGLTHGPKR